jgi:protein-tyrosine phosphatase
LRTGWYHQEVGYVDIHSHVLYGIDDGAQTIAESLAMLELAAASGTTDIVATPHANGRYEFNPELIEQRISELSARVPHIRIHRGCDFHLQIDNIEDAIANPAKYTINHHNYLLVEFPDLAIFTNTDEILSQLLDAGLVPIITHPERNVRLQERVDDLARWVEGGCYLQVTAGACTGRFGRRAKAFVDTLMKNSLVHFIASDAHDCHKRSPSLSEAHVVLADHWGEDRVRPLIVDNPKAVLTGDTLDVEPPTRGVKRKWYQFWA